MMRIGAHHRRCTVAEDLKAVPPPSSKPTQKPRATRALPTDRITFQKQLDLLRAYAAIASSTGRGVSNKAVADVAKMADSTASLANAFFTDVGFLQRGDGGLVPAAEVVSYYRAHQWNPDGASTKLAPILTNTWFGKVLLPKVSFRPIEESEAVNDLADAAAAGPELEAKLRMLIEYLEAGGLVQRDGTLLRAGKSAAATPADPAKPVAAAAQSDRRSERPMMTTTFAQPTEGVVQFHISVRVDMAEFAGWTRSEERRVGKERGAG